MSSLPALDQYNRLLLALQEGLSERPPWGPFLSLLREQVGARVVVLALRRPQGQDAGLVFVDGMALEGGRQSHYAEEFGALNPFVDLPDGVPLTLDERISRAELEKSEYYRCYMAPNGHTQLLGLDIHRQGEVVMYLRAIRSTDDPLFGEPEKALFGLLSGHLRLLAEQLDREHSLYSTEQLYQQALTGLALGNIVLDWHLNMIRVSPVAEHLLAAGDGLRRQGSRLRAQRRQDDTELQQALERCAGHDGQAVHAPQALTIGRRRGEPLQVVLRPLKPAPGADACRAPRVSVTLRAPEMRPALPLPLLRELLGLTVQEARLALGLANGLSLDEVAEELGVSRSTVRSHLNSAFQKTGCHQQSALVSLVLGSLAGMSY